MVPVRLCQEDLLGDANAMVKYVKGILGTDSHGGFDAINKNESPLLGLSNVRNALQAFQLREQLQESDGTHVDLRLSGDCLTKKDKSARAGIMQVFRDWIWKLTYDPNFIQSLGPRVGLVRQEGTFCFVIHRLLTLDVHIVPSGDHVSELSPSVRFIILCFEDRLFSLRKRSDTVG